MLVERFRHALRDRGRRCHRGGLCGNLQAPLDLAYVFEIPVEPCAVAGADVLLETRQALGDGIENAAILLPARGSFLGRAASPNRRSKITCG